jgi:hypothetical protein
MIIITRTIDNLYERHPIATMAAMILVAFVCMVAIAVLSHDGYPI